MKTYKFTVYYVSGDGYGRSTTSIQTTWTFDQAIAQVREDWKGTEFQDMEQPIKLISIDKPKFRNYTSWVLGLVSMICNDGLKAEEISMNEEELKGYYNKGVRPEHVYYNIWEQDAGNYWAI